MMRTTLTGITLRAAGASSDEIAQWIDKIVKWEGRCAFVGVPSNAVAAQGQFIEAGFTEDGRLLT